MPTHDAIFPPFFVVITTHAYYGDVTGFFLRFGLSGRDWCNWNQSLPSKDETADNETESNIALVLSSSFPYILDVFSCSCNEFIKIIIFYSLQIPVKEEPRCGTSLSSSPPMSPIDMEDQERIKLERKRQRNRIAASKCRRRKLERIAKLEDKVKILKNDNSELGTVVVKLRQQVCGLKEQVMEHIQCGCQIMLTNQF